MKAITGVGIHTNEQANILSKRYTRKHKAYFTSIKVIPEDPKKPDHCWALTNQFDPKVARVAA